MKTKLLLLHFLVPLFVFAQFTQIGADINGEGGGDWFGYSVSLSSNGSTVAIGGPQNDGSGPYAGHVRVYNNTGGVWTQIGTDIDGETPEGLAGWSVSLSADGSILAIGQIHSVITNGNWAGQVRIYQNIEGTWTQIGEDIDGEEEWDLFGASVSLSADGSIVAIGAPGNNGQVRVYQNIGGSWTQIGADINGEGNYDGPGHSVSLSSDGNIVAIGAIWNDDNGPQSGHVRVYQNTGGTWMQIGTDIDGEAEDDFSGTSVSLSADGSIVAIGAEYNDGNGDRSGHVRIYQNTGGNWTQIGEDIDGEEAGDRSGISVSLSDDGSIVAIGAWFNEGNGPISGHVRVYQNIGGAWTQIGTDIDGEAAGDGSGFATSLSSDGNTVAIGAPDNGNAGHVRVYDLSNPMGFDENSLLDFSVYPSPTTGILNIDSETTIIQIEIYNQLGQLVLSNIKENKIDISSVRQGVYFIKVVDENGDFGAQKVVKN